ncbi:hypothetical protein EDD18DRAFT_1378218 [Armillaria luteobubalina]|uniref:F-box domain-containing protein n=1 Tax=Armillaria luteobubalina TaxID=153913 RepID=A0AA39U4S1_9AGAR|nr:hypothetical protein EDD18DRAFT_1378218 [Armillaria luteobubalina]
MSPTPPNLSNTCPTCGSLTKTTFSVHSRSSRISELLGCNDPPSDNELSDFQNFVKSGPGRIADLNEKIARANEHLAALIDERRILEANIEDARTLSSPIRRVPSDILRGIAFEAIPSQYDVLNPIHTLKDSANSLDSRKSPWTLAQVSHRWRLPIMSAPEMWSSMSLVIKHDEKPVTVVRQMFMTGLRLERSKLFPLTVSLSSSSEADISNHPLLFLISTRSSFIRNLRIQTSLVSYQAFSWWRGRLDQLRRLTLIAPAPHISESQSSGGVESAIDAFEFAPKLKSLTLQPLLSRDSFNLAVRVPNTQICHLDFAIIDWKDLGILRQFRNLNSLHIIYGKNFLPLVPADHKIISLPVLTSITLAYNYGKSGLLIPLTSMFVERDPIFSLLSIPNLARLRLIYGRGFIKIPTILTPNALTMLIFECAGDGIRPVPRTLSTLLESITNLRDLVISSSSTSELAYDVSLLFLSILAHISLPHIRTLDFRGSTLRPIDMYKFVEMVEANRQGSSQERAQMETVYLHSPLTLDPVYARRWKTLIDGGLKVVYGRPEPR